jgi:hypothetical protein
MRNIEIFFGLFLTTLFLLLLFTGCGIETLEIIKNKCGQCHESSIVYEKKRSSGAWQRVVFGMKARGLKITAAEEKELMSVLKKYLTR